MVLGGALQCMKPGVENALQGYDPTVPATGAKTAAAGKDAGPHAEIRSNSQYGDQSI